MAKRPSPKTIPPRVQPPNIAREPIWPSVGVARHLSVLGVLLLMIGLSFLNSFRSGMTLDNRYIIEEYYRTLTHNNPDLELHSRREIGVIFGNDYWFPKGISGLYRPLTVFSYWLDYTVFNNHAPKHDDDFEPIKGADGKPISPATYEAMTWRQYADAPGHLPTFSYHVVNLLLHWLNASLLYFLCLALFKRFWPSAAAAGLFATHPIVTESVTNIIGRADLFAGATILGGLLIHLFANRAAGARRLYWLTALLLVTAFGVFSKESAGAVVFVILFYDLVYRFLPNWKTIDWRETLQAIARALTITLMIFFGVCVFLLVLVPWMGQMYDVDTHYLFSSGTGETDPGIARLRFNDESLSRSTAIDLSNTDNASRPLLPLLAGRGMQQLVVNQKIKVFKSNDPSQWALYRATGTIDKSASHSRLALRYITGNGSISDGDLVTVTFLNSTFPWAITGSLFGLGGLFLATVLLSNRNIVAVIVTPAIAVMILIALGLCYQPRPEETPPGPAQLLFRLHLVQSPSAPQAAEAIKNAQAADQVNPIVRSVCSVSMNGLWLTTLLFVGVEVAFKWLRREKFEGENASSKWKGFFDSYFVLLSVAVLLLVVRDWVFAGSTPAEEPFLDNPIRGIHSISQLGLPSFDEQLRLHPVPGLSLIECKLTAVKVLAKLITLLAWPKTLCSDYSYSQIPNFSWHLSRLEDWQTLIAVAFFAAIGLLTWKLWQRGNRVAVFWIGFFFLAALPTSNLFYAIGSIMAERFMYVPLAAFAALFAMSGFMLAEHLGKRSNAIVAAPRIAAAFFAIVCTIYGVRTYFRNWAWVDDETLWRDAIQHSPYSFRCYQSLAFALYEKDIPKYLDEMIQLDRTGRSIVDGLPNHLNSARMYLHLGMYLSLKGESLMVRNADGTFGIPEAARQYYQEAVETLEKGSAVDRAFDEMIRRRQQLRGDPPEKIGDMGLAPIYGTLAIAQSRLGQVQDALNSIQYQRQLDPIDVDSYRRETMICLDANRLDQAATALIQAILIDNSEPQYWNTLAQIYSRMPGGENALVRVDNQPRLNVQHPLMRQHLIAAYSRFIRDTRRAHRPEVAQYTHDAAIAQFGLPAGLLDPLMTEPIDVCTPQGIQKGVIDPSVLPIQRTSDR